MRGYKKEVCLSLLVDDSLFLGLFNVPVKHRVVTMPRIQSTSVMTPQIQFGIFPFISSVLHIGSAASQSHLFKTLIDPKPVCLG